MQLKACATETSGYTQPYNKWDNVFKNVPSTIRGNSHLKVLLVSFLNTLSQMTLGCFTCLKYCQVFYHSSYRKSNEAGKLDNWKLWSFSSVLSFAEGSSPKFACNINRL